MRLHVGCKFKMSPYLQSRNVLEFFFFFLFFFDPTGSGQTKPKEILMNETDEHVGGNKASLTDTSTLTLDRLEDISQLLFFFFFVSILL